MPRSNLSWQLSRPAEGYYSSELRSRPSLPVRTFLPVGYEPNYPYPLLVFFHGQGSNEDQILRLAPRLSRRNYICISVRGPEILGHKADGRGSYGWGTEGQFDAETESYVLSAIEQTQRSYHIHSERIFLAGFCEGATPAYRLGLSMPDRIGGIIALNGRLPKATTSSPLFRLPEIRNLPVFLGHGIANSVVPLTHAKQDFRLLYSAGVDVTLRTYPTNHKLHTTMLGDIDQWIIDRVNAELDQLIID
ncbi:alpha/beta hydrolase [Tuwongella immobilis]|uniref:Phospholipase/carboxylesterase/thioesterase domain-containing protein n=1 Tax=Tuwongella immobilis TaxID=692036 RepID=A0A6C2YRV6_9BACT|nr:esterase [Tuwongella immobilis]VIP04400.1 phospholipase carboxylesterase : Putative esterase OS=Singulisphaera acidiphila (strain ATCC BAA-1392 / DSM 18658 / VKM B-2454 / MOB10) GN=Sinac_0857 PE=4 SV=1: Abhydrolase_2 [Tuwongella immobilis]VTS06162.1 phospholipase carboxylesterase : Putative esterase OS=Singulisphaera acidiphila (strain ATCC BAA-1392 / DSM 18658 / VKM B-2454 / MOB10) GN=Sinac_0857 PE=4 SV=1: Abhydrolase_2 [Tuwongella immobilis]